MKKISKRNAQIAMLFLVIGLGAVVVYWVNWILALAYVLVSAIMLVYPNERARVASRFWILIFPFIGVLNPSKLGWFLAFLVVSWVASKNAFEKEKKKET